MNFSNSSIGSRRDPFSSFESVSLDTKSKETSSSSIGENYKAPGMFSGIATAFTATFKSLLGSSRKETSLKNGSSLMQSTKQGEGGFSLRSLLGKMTLSFSKKDSEVRNSFESATLKDGFAAFQTWTAGAGSKAASKVADNFKDGQFQTG